MSRARTNVLDPSNGAVVVGMGTDPEPVDRVLFEKAEGAVAAADLARASLGRPASKALARLLRKLDLELFVDCRRSPFQGRERHGSIRRVHRSFSSRRRSSYMAGMGQTGGGILLHGE